MQGQYYDPEIDLCYNRYRYFDPQICSFISQDPLGLAAGENIYAYAPNVWGWVDPLGLCKTDKLLNGEDFNMALGLSVHQTTRSPDLLKNFAKHVNSKTYGDIYKSWWPGSMEKLESNILRAMNEAKSLKVNLDGLIKNTNEFPELLAKGSRGIEPMEVKLGVERGNITNWEVHTIESSPSLKDKTTYYFGGKPVSVP
jgi:RHS repeat-associated protein